MRRRRKPVSAKESEEEHAKRLANAVKHANPIVDARMHLIECPECRKRFGMYGYHQWAYRINNTRFCSYTCMRKAQDILANVPKGARKKDDKKIV